VWSLLLTKIVYRKCHPGCCGRQFTKKRSSRNNRHGSRQRAPENVKYTSQGRFLPCSHTWVSCATQKWMERLCTEFCFRDDKFDEKLEDALISDLKTSRVKFVPLWPLPFRTSLWQTRSVTRGNVKWFLTSSFHVHKWKLKWWFFATIKVSTHRDVCSTS